MNIPLADNSRNDFIGKAINTGLSNPPTVSITDAKHSLTNAQYSRSEKVLIVLGTKMPIVI